MATTDTPQIIIGTTPTVCITLEDGVNFTENESIIATIKQGNRASVISGDRIEINGNQVFVFPVQKDTIRFREGDATLQLNWVYADGTRGAIFQIELELLPNDYRKVINK